MGVFHRQLPANEVGRDFVMGDLHGCLELLEAELARIQFNPAQDRLLSVGDLIDRGPNSLGCLRLLREPWFYAVVGNHEDMLLSFYRQRSSTYHSRSALFHNGGRWVLDLDDQERNELIGDLLPRVLALPYVFTVGANADQYHLAHAELMTGSLQNDDFWLALQGLPIDRKPNQMLTDETITDDVLSHMTAPLTWGRRLASQIAENEQTIETPMGTLAITEQPWNPGLSLTYVGHTPLQTMTLHRSHLFIDRGAYLGTPNTQLLVLEHQSVLKFLIRR